MNAAELLMDLARLRIRLEARVGKLRYHPRSAVTPDLIRRLKTHKGELLALLQPTPDTNTAVPAAENTPLNPVTLVCRCCSPTWRDVPIHGGQSVRRDCGRCGRFIRFTQWQGKDAGHIGQHPI